MKLREKRWGWLFSFALAMATCTGCYQQSPFITIHGQVTLDGEPIEQGTLTLMPTDGKGITGGGSIENGYFEAQTSPGEIAVLIYSQKKVPKPNATPEEIDQGLDHRFVEQIPNAYNERSLLRIEVTRENTQFDFPLTSDGKDPFQE